MSTVTVTSPDPADSPLSSASLRYLLQQPTVGDLPGPDRTRPFGLAATRVVESPVARDFRYCPRLQVAVDEHGRPLIETLGKKDWKTKASTDGDEGPEENWGWEEH